MVVLVRAKGAELETVNPQALEGVPDAMSVSNLTQASLLHTVRERYNRDEVSRKRLARRSFLVVRKAGLPPPHSLFCRY